MAPLPNVPNVIKTVIRGVIDNEALERWANVHHWLFTGGPPAVGDLIRLATFMGSLWSNHIAPASPSPTQLRAVDATDLSSATGAAVTVDQTIHGTRGDDSIPANAALVTSYPTALRYRGGHPRTYWFIGGNADLEGAGKWSTAFTQEAAQDVHAFLSGMIGHTEGTTTISDFVTVSYHSNHALRPQPLILHLDLSNMLANQAICSQRRRIEGINSSGQTTKMRVVTP